MAKTPKLTITVGPDGTVTTDFFHFAGRACLESGRQLHAALAEFGIATEVTGFTPKPELSDAPAELSFAQITQAQAELQEGGR